MIADKKREMRAQMRSLERQFIDSGQAAESGAAVLVALESSEAFKKAGTILSYMSIPGEVRTHEANKRWSAAGKRVVLPLVKGDSLILKEYDPARLIAGYRGILEPSDDAVDVDPSEIDLALVPGVAFTELGGRLGRGKGFYDRLLPQLKCRKVGLCYPFRIVESVPSDPWDQPLDEVIYK